MSQTKQKNGGLIQYFKESFVELKKVVWPSRSEAMRMTGFVIVFVVIFTAYIYGIDSVIGVLLNLFLVKG